MLSVSDIRKFGATPTGLSAPDSITIADGSVLVEYGNGAVSTGGSGSSTIIQYDKAGNVQHTYDIAGSVDGLKYNPYTGKVWALQNQDGNSTLSLIDPNTHTVSAPIAFANASATRGYDDVVFEGNKVFLSYTNPASDANPNNAPTVVELIGGEHAIGRGDLITQPILTTASTGVNTVTGKTETVPQIDPDSLKMAPNGDLIFSSADGGVITQIHNPGATNQAVSFTEIKGVTAGSAGLDDVIKTNATSGTFYVSDAKGDRVQSFHVRGLNAADFYGSVGNAFGQIDPKTGVFTPLVSSANDPGFGASHGVSFVADGVGPNVASLGEKLRSITTNVPQVNTIGLAHDTAAGASLGFPSNLGVADLGASGAQANQATLLSHYMAASFPTTAGAHANVIADPNVQAAVLARPSNHG